VMQLERLLCDLAKAVLEKHKRYLGWPTIGREEKRKKKGFWRVELVHSDPRRAELESSLHVSTL